MPHRFFASSQLRQDHLDTNPQSGSGRSPGKAILGFATADVILLRWRLGRLTNNVRDGELLSVRTLPARSENIDPTKPFVASITLASVEELSLSDNSRLNEQSPGKQN